MLGMAAWLMIGFTTFTLPKLRNPINHQPWMVETWKKHGMFTIYRFVDFATIHRMLLYVAVFSERPSFWSISWWLAYRLPQQFSQICRCFIGTSKDRNVNYHYFCNFSRNLLFYCLWICIYIYFSIPSQDVLWSKTHVEMKPSSKRGVPIWMVSNIKFCTVMALNSCKWDYNSEVKYQIPVITVEAYNWL